MIRHIGPALLALSLWSCSESVVVNELEQSEVDTIIDALETDEVHLREEAFEDALRGLFDLGVFVFDPIEFKECDADQLTTLDERRLKSETVLNRLDQLTRDLSGDEVFSLMLDISRLSEDEIYKKLQLPSEPNLDIEDTIVIELIMIAAKRDSVKAINEIGAMHLYCYFGIEQDIEKAVEAYERSVKFEDELAQMSLGKIYYQGLGGYHLPLEGIDLQNQAFETQLENLIRAQRAIYQAEKDDWLLRENTETVIAAPHGSATHSLESVPDN